MTEYLARISARKPFLIIAIWAVIGLVAGGFAVDAEIAPWPPPLTDFLDRATTTEFKLSGSAGSERADRLLEDRLRGPKPVTELIIFQSSSVTVDDPSFLPKVQEVATDILALGPDIVALPPDFDPTTPPPISEDRSTTFFAVIMTGSFEDAVDNVPELLHVVEEADGKDGFRVLMVGDASTAHDNNELSENDLRRGERIGLPIALIILIVLFGTIAAALMPIGLSIAAIAVALGITALVGQVFDLTIFVTLMIIMIGLAVGIDYSLVIISRYRDELARGLDTKPAIERAGATAGRTVLFSGITVVIALCGILIVPFSFFQSLAIGAILVVLVALAATLTLLPANLAIMGPRINHFPIPFFGKSRIAPSESSGQGFWELITRIVTKSPVISFIIVAAPMVAATYFYFDIETGLNGVDAFPEGTQTREAFFVMEEHFSFGLVNPTEIVIDGDIDSPAVRQAIGELQASLAAHEGLEVVPGETVNDPRDLALFTVIIPGEPRTQEAVDVVNTIRDQYIPDAFDGVDAEVFVGGISAQATDVYSIVQRYTPIVFAFVLGFSFLVLMLVFRSIVIPIKAVFMNLLSVGTAYGLMVLVFQKGGAEFLGFQHAEVIDVWIPLFLFSILFGLSMDYHVFLLSRIRERYDQTGDNAEAVAYGLRSTAGLITGAALIMVAVFGAFASGKTIINQQVGFGLSVAVLLDATLVRSVLVPASMDMLGKRNWYLPSWLNWLPDLRIEAEQNQAPIIQGQSLQGGVTTNENPD